MTGTDPRNAGKGRHDEKDAVVHHYTEEELHNLDVGHDPSDVDVRAILLFAVSLTVVTVVSAVVVWGVFRVFEYQAAARDPQVSPLAIPETEMPRHSDSPFFGGAPQPQLITNEPAALREFRHNEDQVLHGYGWVDEKAKVAHIPIEEAKKRLLEHGLPARTGAAVAPWLGTHAPAYGESSSGRRIPVK
jgi:hypothetical protein